MRYHRAMTPRADLETLTGIYQRFIEDWFDRDQTRTGWQGPATEAGR